MTAPVNQAPSGISSSPGGGVAPGDVTLQLAYDNGNEVLIASGPRPVTLTQANNDGPALLAAQTGSPPASELGVIEITTEDDTGSWAALLVEALHANVGVRLLRAMDEGRANVWCELTANALYFVAPSALAAYALIHAGEGKQLVLQSGFSGDGSNASNIKIGPAFGGDDVDGGVTIEGSTGRVEVNTHHMGPTIADDRRGAMRWPRVGTGLENATECDPPAEGDTVLRREEIGELSYRTKGFRGYREAAYGLFMRGYQRDFDNGLLVGADLTVVHDLDTQAPLVQLYEDQGTGYQLINAGAGTFTVFTPDADTTLVTFDAGMLPLANSWKITIGGF